VADLRHLEGFLVSVGRERVVSSLDARDTALSVLAATRAKELGRVADQLEEGLAQWVS
jgi:hypothetical protein